MAGPRPPARFQNRQTDPARALRCASALGAADVAVGVDRLVLHVLPGGGDARGAACADEAFGRHGGGVLRRRVPSPHRVLRVAGCGTPRRGAFSRSLREDRTARPEAVRGAARAGCGRRRNAHRDGRGGPPPAPGRLCRAARPRAQEIHRLHPARTFGRARRVGLPPSGADGAPADGVERPARTVRRRENHRSFAGRHRFGQDLHYGQGHRGGAAPHACHGAEQDACCWCPKSPLRRS